MPFPKETEGSRSIKQRSKEIKQSPEWRAMIKLSRNSEFLEILEVYWQKFSQKRKILEKKIKPHSLLKFITTGKIVSIEKFFREKTFKEELKIIKKPESRYYLQDGKITNGSIKLKIFREIENYLGSKITCNSYFTIFCDLEANLLVGHREFVDGKTIKKFEGTLDEFYDYMKKKLTQQNISYLDLLTKL